MGFYIKPTPFSAPNGLPTELRRILENIAKTITPLWKHPVLDATLLEGVQLTSGVSNDVPHGLGRAFRGWWVADCTTLGVTVARNFFQTSDRTKFIALQPSLTCTVSLVVF